MNNARNERIREVTNALLDFRVGDRVVVIHGRNSKMRLFQNQKLAQALIGKHGRILQRNDRSYLVEFNLAVFWIAEENLRHE